MDEDSKKWIWLMSGNELDDDLWRMEDGSIVYPEPNIEILIKAMWAIELKDYDEQVKILTKKLEAFYEKDKHKHK